MKPVIALLRNPLQPECSERCFVEPGSRIIDFLQGYAPDGFGMPIRVFVNQKEVALADLDRKLYDDDICSILISPAELSALAIAAINAAISLAIAVAIRILFPPKKPAERDAANPVYDIGASKNAARLGGPIPIIYSGSAGVLTTPDYAAAPYIFYSKIGDNIQYVDLLMCVGHGKFDDIQLSDIVFGDTPANDMPPGTVQFQQFQQSGGVSPVLDHNSTFGTIESKLWDTLFGGGLNEYPFMEYVYTLPEVTNFEFTDSVSSATSTTPATPMTFTGYNTTTNTYGTISVSSDFDLRPGREYTLIGAGPNAGTIFIADVYPDTSSPQDSDGIFEKNILVLGYALFTPVAETSNYAVQSELETSYAIAGPYVASPVGSGISSLFVDFSAPQGLYRTKKSDGSYRTLGQPDGAPNLDITLKEIDSNNVLVPGGVLAMKNVQFTSSGPDAVRRTFEVNGSDVQAPHTAADFVGKRYQVTVEALQNMSSGQRTQNKLVLAGIRTQISHPTTSPVYANTTLLAVRVKATNGVSEVAQSQLKVRVKRNYKLLDGTVGASGNPVDIVHDIYTDPEHGVGRPDSEIDMVKFAGLRNLWNLPNIDAPEFNGVYLDKSTAWDAMETTLALGVSRPAVETGFLSIVADKKKPVRQHVFNDGNTVAGSFRARYELNAEGDQDSIQVEYRNLSNMNQAYVKWPEIGIDGGPTFNPAKFVYFGLTSKSTAEKLARLLWNRRMLQRTSVTFQTDMDGVFPMVGDRMFVASSAARWGVSGRIMDVRQPESNSPILVLDKTIDRLGSATLYVMVTDSEGASSLFSEVTIGDEPNFAVMDRPLTGDIDLSGDKEPPRYTIDTTQTRGRNMTLTKIVHNGGSVFTLEGVYYDIYNGNHRLFDGAPIHLTLDDDGNPL